MMQQAECASGWKSPTGREQTARLLSKENHYPENHDLLGIAALPGAHVKSFNEGQVFTQANAVEWPDAREMCLTPV